MLSKASLSCRRHWSAAKGSGAKWSGASEAQDRQWASPVLKHALFLPLGGEQSGLAMVAKLLQRELLPKKKAPLRGAFQRAFKDDHRRRAQKMSTHRTNTPTKLFVVRGPSGG